MRLSERTNTVLRQMIEDDVRADEARAELRIRATTEYRDRDRDIEHGCLCCCVECVG